MIKVDKFITTVNNREFQIADWMVLDLWKYAYEEFSEKQNKGHLEEGEDFEGYLEYALECAEETMEEAAIEGEIETLEELGLIEFDLTEEQIEKICYNNLSREEIRSIACEGLTEDEIKNYDWSLLACAK